MPGIVVFSRRWSFGSDDLVVPAVSLLILHFTWLLSLVIISQVSDYGQDSTCAIQLVTLERHVLGFIAILVVKILIEGLIFYVSLRGSILNPSPRSVMEYMLYSYLVILMGEQVWQIIGVMWIVKCYQQCALDVPKKADLGMIVFNWLILFGVIISGWCTYDIAGRKWVKMRRFQESLKEKSHRNKRSSGRRNWRQRKAIRAYEESWDRRFRLLCCCVERDGSNKSSIAEVAKLFTEFFRDLDVVPSDVLAGFVLLRRYQKLRMRYIVTEGSNDVYQYLSGVAVTPQTQFLQLGQPEVLEDFKLVIHYMRYALAAYGWAGFMMINGGVGLCKMLPNLRCCCCLSCRAPNLSQENLLNDNCCFCNFVALLKLSNLKETDIAYVTYHVEIGQTPFYVALDHVHRKVVLCVRGTLSMQDVLTDLKAEAETLPLEPVKEEWLGHKGMVQAAVYIKNKLENDGILSKAFHLDEERESYKYDLVLVGHSLGAGTAAILAILLHQEYPTLHCYAFSPPGGLLSEQCVEDTKHFITSVVVGKDVVPRIGLPQLEMLRTDLINVIKNSTQPKWKIITKGFCCGTAVAEKMREDEVKLEVERDTTAHPLDSQIGLSSHRPLFPPGRIIHVVRCHPKGKKKRVCGEQEPVYQAIWANSTSFDEVLVSPTMINDHMPDRVMEALEKVLVNVAPPKPQRLLSEEERKVMMQKRSPSQCSEGSRYRLVINEDFSMRCSVPCYKMPNASVQQNQTTFLAPSIAWDQTSETNCILASSTLDQMGEVGDSTLEIPTDLAGAPLATPESLSEASSICSAVSRNNSFNRSGKKIPTSNCSNLETIKQSPESKVKKGVDSVKCSRSSIDCSNTGTCSVMSSKTSKQNDAVTKSELSSSQILNESKMKQKQVIDNRMNASIGDADVYVNQNHQESCYSKEKNKSLGQDINEVDADCHSPTINPCSSSAHQCRKCLKHTASAVMKVDPTEEGFIKISQSESHLLNLSAKYVMRRSTEQRDITKLQDSSEVFNHECECIQEIPNLEASVKQCHVKTSQSRAENLKESLGAQISIHSLEEDSEQRLSSSHSDDIFDFPLQETDV